MPQTPPSSIDLPLPADWQDSVRSAFVGAVGLAPQAIVFARCWAVNSRVSRVRLAGECNRLRSEVALLNRELDLLRVRFGRIPARNRPHFSPPERLSVLELKAARAWNASQMARRLLLAPGTVAAWLKRLDEQGEQGLVRVPVPVNRFPDFVGRLVQELVGGCVCVGRISCFGLSRSRLNRDRLLEAGCVSKRVLLSNSESTPSAPRQDAAPHGQKASSISQYSSSPNCAKV